MSNYEHCNECDALTGRAGRDEDSLYHASEGPVGEEVEVLGYFNPGELLQDAFRFEPDSGSVPVMAVDQYQRIVGGLKAEIKELKWDVADWQDLYHEGESENAKLRETLTQIAKWRSHTLQLAIDEGSIGVREYYRNIAQAALDTTKEKAK